MEEFHSEILKLEKNPKKWLITGVAGFIGSHLLETLLRHGQSVVGLDNFFTGHYQNLDEVKRNTLSNLWKNFYFIEGSICNILDCDEATKGIDYVLHQAAVGSVPRSIENPQLSNEINVNGFLNMLISSKKAGVKRFVYAASSSTYGDDTSLPKIEDKIGRPLSPYAVTKYVNELYADVFSRVYGLEQIGLRYFNVFGPRQDPNGMYSAVIPKWTNDIINNTDTFINGDGEISRDFCFVENIVQANILAACVNNAEAINQIYNIAYGEKTSLNNLHSKISDEITKREISIINSKLHYRERRLGDVIHSQADIGKAKNLLGYSPKFDVTSGLSITVDWFINARNNSIKYTD